MHIRYLRAHYDVVPLEDLISTGSDNACAITFDDGWRDNYVTAFPILRAHGVPATIFLATNLVGTDRLAVAGPHLLLHPPGFAHRVLRGLRIRMATRGR